MELSTTSIHHVRTRDIERELVCAAAARALFDERPSPVHIGRFELTASLGRGAMGSVYGARDTRDGSEVALKVLHRVDARAIYLLKREFRALSDVVHPNVVQLHELFVARSEMFFTMELIDGSSFLSWVRRASDRTLDVPRLRDALLQLARGVDAIHAAGKLHCDLKSSNVLVTREGRIVLLDFGLVGELGKAPNLTRPDTSGTPAYLAPEQLSGVPATPARDWYAVGVMLFEALTGRLPFAGHPAQLLRAKQSCSAPDPRELVRELPSDLCELCNQLLRRDWLARAGRTEVLRAATPERQGAFHVQTRSALSSSFVGREDELDVLDGSLANTRPGEPACVLLTGPSGIGKSALLAHFARRHGERALVLRGRCYPQESVPYKVLDGVIDELSRHLAALDPARMQALLPARWDCVARLFPVLGQLRPATRPRSVARSAGPGEQRELGLAALQTLLATLSIQRPLIVIIDDLQWGDLDGAHMLASLLSGPSAPALLVAAASRWDTSDDEGCAAAMAVRGPLSRACPVRVLELMPFRRARAAEPARTTALLDSPRGAKSPPTSRRLTSDAEPTSHRVTPLCTMTGSRLTAR